MALSLALRSTLLRGGARRLATSSLPPPPWERVAHVGESALLLRRFLEKRAKGSETKIRKGHEFDAAPLLAYLHPVVGSPADGDGVAIGQFSHGQSNPTFTVRWDGGAVVVRLRRRTKELARESRGDAAC